MCKNTIIVLAILMLILFVVFPFVGVVFDRQVTRITSDCSVLPAYMTLNGLYYDNIHIDPASICESEHQQNSFREVLLIDDNRVFVVYTSERPDDFSWHLAFIDRNTLILTELYRLSNAQSPYVVSFDNPPSGRSAFYHNDHIIMTDGHIVVCYNLENDHCEEFQYSSFTFPDQTYWGWTEDGTTVNIKSNDKLETFSASDFVKSSASVARIVEQAQGNKLYFRDGCVQYVDGALYVITEFYNPFGVPYGLIMMYDEHAKSWQYVTCCINWDTIEQQFYIVPTM